MRDIRTFGQFAATVARMRKRLAILEALSAHPDYYLAGEVKANAREMNRMRLERERNQRANATTRVIRRANLSH